METNEDNPFITLEDLERLVRRIPRKRMMYGEWLEPTEEEITDHAVDNLRFIESDKKPIRWLNHGSSV